MSGFKNEQLNEIAKNNIFEDIINFMFISLEYMKNELLLNNIKLKNKEEEIRNHLLENYLNDKNFRKKVNYDDWLLIFNAEVAEGYNQEDEKYNGRVDIKVFSINTLQSYGKDYYIIECKRLDGSEELNKKFITEGVCRFILDKPKYSSFNNKNIMLGFIVKDMNIDDNVNRINEIQGNAPNIHTLGDMQKYQNDNENYYLYKSVYRCGDRQIELSHMFYNLFMIIE